LSNVQLPLPPRDFWQQRGRWTKATHLYVLDANSNLPSV
jgi:hypothetical protein